MVHDGSSIGNTTPRTVPLVSPKTLMLLAQQSMSKSPAANETFQLDSPNILIKIENGDGHNPSKKSKSGTSTTPF